MITKALLDAIIVQYTLPHDGTHGLSHWARLLTIGRRLCANSPERLPVVELFTVFHDACRINEHIDHQHGLRGARLAEQWRGRFLELDDLQFNQLYTACAFHTDGKKSGDVVIQTCWDCDRLDLDRVGILPDRGRISPAAGEDTLYQWAVERSRQRLFPPEIKAEWGL